jgi:hypothetical protein
MLDDEAKSLVTDYIRNKVAAGFDTRADIAGSASEVFSDEASAEDLLPFAASEVDRAIEEQLRAEMEWPETTDCDRLDAAFAELESNGIVARQDFSCCGTCGVAEIFDEMDPGKGRSSPVRGYTFFHMQDTEAAADGSGLYLNYGSVKEGEGAAVAIGHEIVSTLRKHGLTSRWDGALNKRIDVGIKWQRRYRR